MSVEQPWLPAQGYFSMFRRMVDHPLIQVATGTDFFAIQHQLPSVPVIYTGPIDRYFEYRLGRLAWRTLDFEREVVASADFQGTAVMNYADANVPFTRIHEFRHLHPERRNTRERTTIVREYSRSAGRDDEPYYPVNTIANRRTYGGYRILANNEEKVIFGGRLGTYRYLDMHQAVGAALKLLEHQIVPYARENRPLTSQVAPE